MGPEEHGVEATIWDKVAIVPVIFGSLCSAVVGLMTGPFRGADGSPTMATHVGYSGLRYFNRHASIKQQLWIQGSTEQLYLDECSKRHQPPETTSLSNGFKIHWFGKKSAKCVYLYYHGGGYAFPASPGHVQYAAKLQDKLAKQGHDIAIAMPAYILSSKARYPEQLRQGVGSLRHLIETEGRDPGDIIVGGDSAGANLTCGVISHILHPHPNIPELDLTAPLRGFLLTSPWVSFKEGYESFHKNIGNDILDESVSKMFYEAYVDKKDYDNYNHPVQAPIDWWSGTGNLAKDIFVWAGGHETLLDGIQEWAAKFKEAVPKAQVLITQGDAHDAFVFELVLGQKPREGTRAIESWLASKL